MKRSTLRALLLTSLALVAACTSDENEVKPPEEGFPPSHVAVVEHPQVGGTASITTEIDPELRKALAKAVPKQEFRKGHVTPFDVKAIKARSAEAGFSVQLPSSSPIPTVAIHQGRVYVGGGFNSKTFFCLDGKSGEPIWGVNLDDDGPSAPVCAGGLVVFNTESCTIFALEADTGKLRWAHWMGDPMMAMPAIADGRVYTSYPRQGNPRASHVLACLDLQSGAVQWERWIDSEVMTAPVVAQGSVHVNTFSGHAYVFGPRDGELTSLKRERATSAPTVFAQGIAMSKRTDASGKPVEALQFVTKQGAQFRSAGKQALWLDKAVQSRTLYAQEAAAQDAGNGFSGGAPATANAKAALENVGYANVSSLQGYQGARPLAYKGNLMTCDGDTFTCVDARGKTQWSFKVSGDLKKTGGFLATPPFAAGKYVFTATFAGELLQVDPAKGEVVKRYPLGGNVRFQPVAMGGRVYVTTVQGQVVCVDTEDASITGWPMWGKDAAHTGVGAPAP